MKPISQYITHKNARHLLCFVLLLQSIILFPLLHTSSASALTPPQTPKEVLIVHSAYQGYPWTDFLNQGIHQAFDNTSSPVDLIFEYLDYKRNHDPLYFDELQKLWQLKYHAQRIDLVMVCDNEAYDFVLRERDHLFKDIPIVFTAYIGYKPEMLQGNQPITGVIQETDVQSTIDVALLLHPKTEKVVFVVPGAPAFRMAWLEGLDEQYEGQVELVTITTKDLTKIDREIESLGRNIVVIPLNSTVGEDGTYIPFDKFVSHLAVESPFPVYALWDIALEPGIVGGKMVTGKSQGYSASKLALQILQGTPISEISVITESPNQYIFDWKQMQRFGLKTTDLPEKAVVINNPISFYAKNKTIVHSTLAVLTILICLIFALIIAITNLRRVRNSLKNSEAQMRKMIERSPLPMVITNSNREILSLNNKFTELFGYTLEDVQDGTNWREKAYPDPEYRKKVFDSWLLAIEKAKANNTDTKMQEWDVTIKDGSTRRCEFYMVPLQEVSLIIMNDISERKNAEEKRKQLELRLQQAQKLEAIGTLAGGIAHDFNNILSVIIGFTEIAQDDTPKDSTVINDLEEVLMAANRAKNLVQQILAFSRQEKVKRTQVLLQFAIKETMKMLRPSLPSTIEIQTDIDQDCGYVCADLTQIHQVIMNLCTNANHAMEGRGGILTIGLKQHSVTGENQHLHSMLAPGDYIKLTVADTGQGIALEHIDKIFDPYYTTKEVGKGTGMGLATIHGIMTEYGGAITVHSDEGHGATFEVFFPKKTKDSEKSLEDISFLGSKRILLIDDEEQLVLMSTIMLEQLGHTVTSQTNSLDALELFEKGPDLFDIIITDQTMPEMTGTEFAERALQIRPTIPILLCTGNSNQDTERKAKSVGIREIALKPVRKKELEQLILKILS